MANSKTTIFNKPGQSKPPSKQPPAAPVAPIANAGGGVQIGGKNLFANIDTEIQSQSNAIVDSINAIEAQNIGTESQQQETNSETNRRLQRILGVARSRQQFLDSLDETNIELPSDLGANPNETIGVLANFFDEINSLGSETTSFVTLERSASVPRATSNIQRLAAIH